ncbi:hypothetical protein B0H11DRAFT_2367211 [Mycena galericulata]|nr:hypothetical protein B0H11DRAFT_2367211 [Mycena galericulata]
MCESWGVTPIVSEVQDEESLEFPEELEFPWKCLQQHFGTTADNRLEYSVTVGMSEAHTSTEFWNTKLITEMEERVLPMYHLFAHAIAFLDGGDIGAVCDALKSANEILKPALKYFFSSILWLAYVQGYQGWTLDGFDGISGGQSLLFRTLSAFLGIRPFPRPEKESLHLPLAQRAWLNFLREYDIHAAVKARGEVGADTSVALEALLKQLRFWRMGQIRRMQPYESAPRPERRKMTAGTSLVDAPDGDQMIEDLKRELGRRLTQTV